MIFQLVKVKKEKIQIFILCLTSLKNGVILIKYTQEKQVWKNKMKKQIINLITLLGLELILLKRAVPLCG